MKRIALISVLAAYLILNLGISVKLHYCGGSISFVEFFPIAHKNCCQDKKASCCKDTIAYINPETTQAGVENVQFSFPDYAKYCLVLQDFTFLSLLESDRTEEEHSGQHRSVFYRKVPLYLYNRVILV